MTRKVPTPSFRQSLGFCLQRASKVSSALTAAELPGSVDGRHFAILSYLRTGDGRSQKELGLYLALKRAGMVGLVDELERRTWVERVPDKLDKRAWAVTITPIGISAWQNLRSAVQRADDALLAAASANASRMSSLLAQATANKFANVAGLADSVGFLIGIAHREHAEVARATLSPLGIDPREFGTLSALDETGSTTQQHLAEYMAMTPPAMLEIVEALEARHLIVRKRNPSNRRANDVSLSGEGASVLDAARRAISRPEADNPLKRAESAELAELLATAIADL